MGILYGSDKQREMLQTAGFICLNKADYEKTRGSLWYFMSEEVKSITEWYVPDWFNQFVNETAKLEFGALDYEWIMHFTEKGILKPSKELLVKAIPPMIFEERSRVDYYVPENLVKRTITLKEHFWYLFEHESNLHFCDRFLRFGKEVSKEKIGWKVAIADLTNKGKLDRKRILKESLLASNKNFNKVLSGWFIQLFSDLKPSHEESFFLQKELFSVLNSPHSKVVNTSLQLIKSIFERKDFDLPGFLDAGPVLLTSSTKATVAATLVLLEKIAKKNAQFTRRIATLSCQAFMHADDELQTKTAKLLVSIGDNSEAVKTELQAYSSSIMTVARKILDSSFGSGETPTTQVPTEIVNQVRFKELIPIPPVRDLDDLVFLASQVFDNNEPWHLEQFIGSFIRFQSKLKPDHLPRFEPAFQRALNILNKGLRSNMGNLEQLLAMFFIDLGNYWMQKFAPASSSLEKLFKKYDHKNGEMVGSWTVSPENSTYTEQWGMSYAKQWGNEERISVYKVHNYLLTYVFHKITVGDDLPLLSEPTHAPGWIKIADLIERLEKYQQSNKVPDEMDLQIAISRCYLKYVDESQLKTVNILKGEYFRLLQFLLQEDAEPEGPFVHKTAWMAASLAKKNKKTYTAFEAFPYSKKTFGNYTGQLPWEAVEEETTYKDFAPHTGEYVEKKGISKQMKVFKDYPQKEESKIKKYFSDWFSNKKDSFPFFYDWLVYKTMFVSIEHNDIKRLLLLVPNNPQPLLADIINQSFRYSSFFQEDDKKFVIATLQLLHEIWDGHGEIVYVFIGVSMISSDKTAASIAAEIWINAVEENKMNNEKLGEAIGRIEKIEFAPMKRFTDLATKQLLRISDKHNKALLIVIENILKQLPDQPITNLKKLLEIYVELVALTNASLTDPILLNKMEKWKTSTGLQKLIASVG